MRIRLTVPGEPNAETLGIALEAATRLAQHDMQAGDIPPIEDAIRGGIEWKPEPPGDESFDKPSTVLERGWGDCDDLAPWLAAEMRETGFDGGAQAIAIPSGHRMWHAIVRGSDGDIYDPSKWAGMPHDVVGGSCACCRPLNAGKPALGIGRSSVRVDVPGLQSRRGCVLGVSHQADCDASDEGRVIALVQAIEDAIITAQLARTGDKRAIKQLAVIYRVLRGDELETACNGMHLRPDQVGLDFSSSAVRNFVRRAREVLASAADELFNGETWTAENGRIVKARKVAMSGHRVGVLPCLAALGPIASAAATAGTIAAVVDPIAAALGELAGKDSDFGKAMATLREGLGPVKLASAIGTGVLALAAGGIPAAAQATAARWAELLRAPGSAQALNDASKIPDIAKTLSWTERALATALPHPLATSMTPQILDLVRAGNYQQAVGTMRDRIVQWTLGHLPISAAEAMAVQALKALVDHAEEVISPGVHVPRVPPSVLDPNLVAPQPETPAVLPAEIEDAEDIRENLRTVPIIVRVPAGWDPVFALGCRQQTDQCP